MIQDIDIWRAAALPVRQHGEDATLHAAMRADELPEGGQDGQSIWLRILRAIEAQLRGRRDEPLH